MARVIPTNLVWIGASDTHVLGGGFREDNYWSKIGLVDADPRARGSVPVAEEDRNLVPNRGGVSFAEYEQGDHVIGGLENWGASGPAGAWAEENTRESIFLMLLEEKKHLLLQDQEF